MSTHIYRCKTSTLCPTVFYFQFIEKSPVRRSVGTTSLHLRIDKLLFETRSIFLCLREKVLQEDGASEVKSYVLPDFKVDRLQKK